MSFVFSCKISEQASGMTRQKKILDTVAWSLKKREHNPIGKAMFDHMEKYEQSIFQYIMQEHHNDENAVKAKITQSVDASFKRGFNIKYHCHLNQFMVDYDIISVLRTDMGYSSWSDLTDRDREICYKGYTTKKKKLPDWNTEEETFND